MGQIEIHKSKSPSVYPYSVNLQLPNGNWIAIANTSTEVEAKHVKGNLEVYFNVKDIFARDPARIYPDELGKGDYPNNDWYWK